MVEPNDQVAQLSLAKWATSPKRALLAKLLKWSNEEIKGGTKVAFKTHFMGVRGHDSLRESWEKQLFLHCKEKFVHFGLIKTYYEGGINIFLIPGSLLRRQCDACQSQHSKFWCWFRGICRTQPIASTDFHTLIKTLGLEGDDPRCCCWEIFYGFRYNLK